MLRPTIYMPSRLIKLLEDSRADGCTRPRHPERSEGGMSRGMAPSLRSG
jgi:hypothetical protein